MHCQYTPPDRTYVCISLFHGRVNSIHNALVVWLQYCSLLWRWLHLHVGAGHEVESGVTPAPGVATSRHRFASTDFTNIEMETLAIAFNDQSLCAPAVQGQLL